MSSPSISTVIARPSGRQLLVLALVALAGVGTLYVLGAPSGDLGHADSPVQSVQPTANETPSEEAFEEPVPGPGDPYFEAEASDGSWISYINPRDEYRSPYLGGGSGKICVTLLNEAGEPIVGESVPNTSVTIPTGESLEWHTGAEPMVVDFPLTDHYDRPLDADQFGTTSDLPQGDGYLDSHCIEWHGLPEDETVEYGEAEIEGDHADRIELVGYVQQAHEAWDTDVDPVDDAVSYEEAGGGWTYQTEGSHGQAVVVFQLDDQERPPGTDDNPSGGDDDSSGTGDGNTSNGDDTGVGGDDTGSGDDGAADGDDDTADDSDDAYLGDGMPGFSLLAALFAVGAMIAVVAGRVAPTGESSG